MVFRPGFGLRAADGVNSDFAPLCSINAHLPICLWDMIGNLTADGGGLDLGEELGQQDENLIVDRERRD